MYKTILAPLDGSKRAEAILPHLEQLAGRYKAKVVFLQAIEHSMLFVRPETVDTEQKEYEEHLKQAKVYLDGLKGVFREKGINARAFITHASVMEASDLFKFQGFIRLEGLVQQLSSRSKTLI